MASKTSVIANARRFLKVMPINDGDILMVRADSMPARRDAIDAMSRALSKTDRENVILIVVDEFDDLSVVNEVSMNELGWFRK